MKRSPLRRNRPLRKSNRKRRAKEFVRVYGSAQRAEFVRGLPCVVCRGVPSDNAHIEGGGVSRKADASKIVPLCRTHHREHHAIGTETFERKYPHVRLEEAAERTETMWQEYSQSNLKRTA